MSSSVDSAIVAIFLGLAKGGASRQSVAAAAAVVRVAMGQGETPTYVPVAVPVEVADDTPAIAASLAAQRLTGGLSDTPVRTAAEAYQHLRKLDPRTAEAVRRVNRIANVAKHGSERGGRQTNKDKHVDPDFALESRSYCTDLSYQDFPVPVVQHAVCADAGGQCTPDSASVEPLCGPLESTVSVIDWDFVRASIDDSYWAAKPVSGPCAAVQDALTLLFKDRAFAKAAAGKCLLKLEAAVLCSPMPCNLPSDVIDHVFVSVKKVKVAGQLNALSISGVPTPTD